MSSAGCARKSTHITIILYITSLGVLECDSVSEMHYSFYYYLGEGPKKKNWWDNKCIKCLWYLLSCILGILAVLLILVFFFFFGCAYEFIKCYLEKKYKDDEDDDSDSEFEDSGHHNHHQNKPSENPNEDEDDSCTCGKVTICIILGALGFLCQPLYLLFYILYGMMECYRRFGCWIFLAAN